MDFFEESYVPDKGRLLRRREKLFSREKGFSLLPNPHPFSKKAKYFVFSVVAA